MAPKSCVLIKRSLFSEGSLNIFETAGNMCFSYQLKQFDVYARLDNLPFFTEHVGWSTLNHVTKKLKKTTYLISNE
jgi:hypothetical protein